MPTASIAPENVIPSHRAANPLSHTTELEHWAARQAKFAGLLDQVRSFFPPHPPPFLPTHTHSLCSHLLLCICTDQVARMHGCHWRAAVCQVAPAGGVAQAGRQRHRGHQRGQGQRQVPLHPREVLPGAYLPLFFGHMFFRSTSNSPTPCPLSPSPPPPLSSRCTAATLWA